MKHFLDIFFLVNLCVCAAAFVSYLPRMSYFFVAFKRQKRLKNNKLNKFAIIVPARDESDIIENCLKSLKKQTYDESLYYTYVIVNDPNDKTIEIVKDYKNMQTIVVENQTCKGHALDGGIKEILKNNDVYDAYIIVDADNIVAEDFIEEMNNGLASGHQIVTAKKMVKNWHAKDKKCRSLICNCTALTWVNLDDMGNRFRNNHNIPITLIGTGLLVRTDVIKELGGWPFRSLTEDYELMMESIVRGYTSLHYSHAKVYTEEALDHKMGNKRRMRWLRGYAQCNKKYRKAIKEKTFRDGSIKWRNFDFLYGIFPLVFLLVSFLAPGLFFLILTLVYFVSGNALWLYTGKLFLVNIIGLYFLFFIYTLISLIAVRKELKISLLEKLLVLFFNPLFLSEYIYIVIAAFAVTEKNLAWEKIERVQFEIEDSFEIEDVFDENLGEEERYV